MTSIFALWLGMWTAPALSLDLPPEGGLAAVVCAPALAPMVHALDRPSLHGLGPLLETLARSALAVPRTPSGQLSGFGIWIDLLTFRIDTAPPPTVAEAAAEL